MSVALLYLLALLLVAVSALVIRALARSAGLREFSSVDDQHDAV